MSLTQNDYLSFLQYWQQAREQSASLIAQRRHFKPAGIAALLPHIYLLEIRMPEMLEIRIAGTTLDVLSQHTLTGQNYLDVCPPQERDLYWQLLTTLHDGPYGCVITREVAFRDSQVHMLKGFTLPLVEHDSDRHYAVGLLGMLSADEMDMRPEGGVAKSSIVDHYYVDLGYGLPESSLAAPTL